MGGGGRSDQEDRVCGGLGDTGAALCAAVGNLEVSQEGGKDCMFRDTGMEWWSGQAHPHWVVGGVRSDRHSLLEAGAVNKQVSRSGSWEGKSGPSSSLVWEEPAGRGV